MKKTRKYYTHKEEEWIKENYPLMTGSELANAYQKEFGATRSKETLRLKAVHMLNREDRKAPRYNHVEKLFIKKHFELPEHELGEAFYLEFGYRRISVQLRRLAVRLGYQKYDQDNIEWIHWFRRINESIPKRINGKRVVGRCKAIELMFEMTFNKKKPYNLLLNISNRNCKKHRNA